jgi:hypothetical protein
MDDNDLEKLKAENIVMRKVLEAVHAIAEPIRIIPNDLARTGYRPIKNTTKDEIYEAMFKIIYTVHAHEDIWTNGKRLDIMEKIMREEQ